LKIRVAVNGDVVIAVGVRLFATTGDAAGGGRGLGSIAGGLD
jgi:hypothetical protein